MSDPGCFWHGKEPIPEHYFALCHECGHVWPKEEDFVAAVRTNHPAIDTTEAREDESLADLPFCPLCAHDF